MDTLASELKERIAWFASIDPNDIAALSLVDRSFCDPAQRQICCTLRIKESLVPLTPYDMYDDNQKAYLRYRNHKSPASMAVGLKTQFSDMGHHIRWIVFNTIFLQTADIIALYDLVDKLPGLTEVVLKNAELCYFKTAFRTLLSAIDSISTLTLKMCTVTAEALNMITRGDYQYNLSLACILMGSLSVTWATHS